MSEVLAMWTVYDHPRDYPTAFVARKFLIVAGETEAVRTHDMFTADTLNELRALLPPGLHRLERWAADEAQIVETWI